MDYEDIFKTFLLIVSVILGFIIAIIIAGIIGGFTIGWFEHKTWNKLHDTNYTWWEWSTGSDFIKNYQDSGKIKTIHIPELSGSR